MFVLISLFYDKKNICLKSGNIYLFETRYRASGDGNCLFNAVSISISDDERLADILRMLTCLELFKNAHLYCNHDLFHEILPSGAFRSLNSIFTACLSNFIFDLGLESNIFSVKKTAAHPSDPKTYAPFLAVLALSNVLCRPIHLYTKPIIDQRLMSFYNNTISPFDKNDKEAICLF